MCKPPKGKETKDKEKEREKDGPDLDISGIMKERDTQVQTFQSPFHQKVSIESQLLSEMPSPAPAAPPGARLSGPLEERLARLEAAVGELRHFISQADRPQRSEDEQ